MSHLSEADQELIREQSAALNQALFGTPAGLSDVRGGSGTGRPPRNARREQAELKSAPRPPTRKERRMLTALKHAPRLAATPAELIAADPETFRDTSVAGLHLVAASLVRKGLVKRGRRNSGPRLYRLTEAGKQA